MAQTLALKKKLPVYPGALFYIPVFIVTQLTGLLMSLVICFILKDFIWGFIRMAMVNSFLLGAALIGGGYVSQRLMRTMGIIRTAAISVCLVTGVGIISFGVVLFLEPALFIYYSRGAFAFLVIDFLFIITLHVISSGSIMYREAMLEKERAVAEERLLKEQMELRLLSSKVNPHFLFNTLNMIITLLREPQKAETAILNLSDLLRQNIEHTDKQNIPASEELGNVRKYLELQKLRFGEKLAYEISGDTDFSILPLVIQPLVENSIKHNMQRVARLSIEIRIVRAGGRNRITVIDSERCVNASMLNKGQGLTITKKRVENSGGVFEILDGGIALSFPQE